MPDLPATDTPRTQRVIRQGSSYVSGLLVPGILITVLVWDVATHGRVDLTMLGVVITVTAILWAMFIRPAVVLRQDSLVLRNLVTDVRIPWESFDDTDRRWNLSVWTKDGKEYTAWAIGGRPERSASAPRHWTVSTLPAPVRPAQRSVRNNPSGVGGVLESTRLDYELARDQGLVPVSDGAVTRRFAWEAVLPVLVGVAVIVAGYLA